MTDAVEVIDGDAAILLTCEHASERMPDGWAWPDADRRLVGTHWAYDLGARELALELAARMGAGAVLSRFSRLIIDPNRPEDSPTLFRKEAEGLPVHLNTTHLDDREAERRIESLLRPYHRVVDERVGGSRAPQLLSMHSFTPVYEGNRRTLEVGVLHDLDEALAQRLAAWLDQAGLRVALNEPYSGRDGLMYSVDRHARAHRREAIELEVRQDLATDPAFRARFLDLVEGFFHHEDRR
ncbi:MAG: N-formylglutamate amidohydrolase [Sandaracinaceae bacterium]|nr:N-formylglutamate amidohydrolase [Sandaracinaceae bacterium]